MLKDVTERVTASILLAYYLFSFEALLTDDKLNVAEEINRVNQQ